MKSLTDKFIDELEEWDLLSIITEKEYKECLASGYTEQYIKDTDVYVNAENRPFPLLKIKVIKNGRISTNYDGGYADYFHFVFKHKGNWLKVVIDESN